jgi:hypothetical protein
MSGHAVQIAQSLRLRTFQLGGETAVAPRIAHHFSTDVPIA